MRDAVVRKSPVCCLSLLMAVIGLAGCASAPPSRQTIQMMRLPLPRSAAIDERAAQADAWNRWASQHLQSGDLVFLRGENRVLLDTINLAEFFTTLTDSPWSHVGLVVVEEGTAFVYDIRLHGGMFHTPFGQLMTNPQVYAVAVRRPTGETAQAAPAAAAFVQDQYRQRARFDRHFRSDDASEFYCAELVEAAYRSAGVELSQPERMADLPGFGANPHIEQFLMTLGQVSEDQQLYVPGNDNLGLWSHPHLQTVLFVSDTRLPLSAHHASTADSQ